MRVILIFLLIGFYTNSILASTLDEFIKDFKKDSTEFYKKQTNLVEEIYNHSRTEATEEFNITAEEYDNLAVNLLTRLQNLHEIFNEIQLEEYPKVADPISESGETDEFDEIYVGVYYDAKLIVESEIKRANALEIDWNVRTLSERASSLFDGIENDFCTLKAKSPEIADCMCDEHHGTYDCFQVIEDWTKRLRNETSAAIQNINENIYKFPLTFDRFTKKGYTHGNLLYGIFLINRHMRKLDDLYDNLTNKINQLQSEIENDEKLTAFCVPSVTPNLNSAYFAVRLQECMN